MLKRQAAALTNGPLLRMATANSRITFHLSDNKTKNQ
jgi:hypothetical protein